MDNNTQDTNATAESFDFRSLVTDEGTFVDGWTDKLPESLKAEFGDSKYLGEIKDPVSLLKSTHGLSKLKGRALLPGKDAKPEDWHKVMEAMPKPKEGEGYGLDADGLTDERLKAFNEKTGYLTRLERVLARAGVPSAIAARIAEADAASMADSLREIDDDAQAVKARLTEAFGGEQQYEASRLAGRDALSRLYGDAGKDEFDDTVAWLEGMGIADHPRVVGLLSRLASRLSPGKIVLGGSAASAPKANSTLKSILPNTTKALGL
jgi:hypothetical protein